MKTSIKTLFLLPVLIAGLGSIMVGQAPAQPFTTVHSFTATSGPYYTNSDGAGPQGGLVLSGNTLYGAASRGGISGNGTVFKVNTDGTGFKTLHQFSASGINPGIYINATLKQSRIFFLRKT